MTKQPTGPAYSQYPGEEFIEAGGAAGGGLLDAGTTQTAGTTAAPLKFTGAPYFGPAAQDGTQLTVLDDSSPTGVIEWAFNSSSSTSEGIHLTGGPNFAGSMIAIGVNNGGKGIYINNYTTGVGLNITNRSTNSNNAAYGFLLSQNSNFAVGAYFSQETNTASMPLKIVNAPVGSVGGTGGAAGQILTAWYRSQAAAADTLLAKVAVDGVLFQVPVTVSGTTFTADSVSANANGAFLEIFDQAGTANQRRFKMKYSSTHFLIQKVTDAGVASTLLDIDQSGNVTHNDASNIILGTTTGTKIGTATTQKLAFFNSTPVVQPATTGETVGFTAGTGTAVNDASTFTGNVGSTAYRISDVVKHLKNLGLIAA